LNRRGQGLTEYGIILLLVVLIGGAVWSGFDIKASLSTIYSTISSDLQSIAGGKTAVAGNYDTGNTKTISGTVLHETSLSLRKKTIYWYVDSNGTKQYTTNDLGFSPLTVHKLKDGSFNAGGNYYTDLNGSHLYAFFKAGDGNIYQMMSDGKAANTITNTNGVLPYRDTGSHIVSDEYAAANPSTEHVTVIQ
jgi:hypothetical protein